MKIATNTTWSCSHEQCELTLESLPGKGKKVILGDLEDQFMTKKTATEIPESLNPASQCILISSMSGRSVPLPA